MAADTASKKDLILGWEVNDHLHPRYWLPSGSRPALPPPDGELVGVASSTIDANAIIVAQTGSGKSTLLGRLVEEILLKTTANVMILDVNGDFRQAHRVADRSLWESAKYDSASGRGLLTQEPSRDAFEPSWNLRSKAVKIDSVDAKMPYSRLRIWWPYIPYEFLVENLDPIQSSWFNNCHKFVKFVTKVIRNKKGKPISIDVVVNAQKMLGMTREDAEKKFRSLLDDVFGGKVTNLPYWLKQFHRHLDTLENIPDEVREFYFGKARELRGGIVSTMTPKPEGKLVRLEVIEISSVQSRATKLLTANSILAARWDLAVDERDQLAKTPEAKDNRVPTFIVIDEAHNMLPAEPKPGPERALSEQLRTIASEGRKFGLFLIMATQRPDKLDPFVVSECDNKAIMKLNSRSVMNQVHDALGLDGIPNKMWDKVTTFGIGRAILDGRWSDPKLMFVASRRTIEGGSSIPPANWAHP